MCLFYSYVCYILVVLRWSTSFSMIKYKREVLFKNYIAYWTTDFSTPDQNIWPWSVNDQLFKYLRCSYLPIKNGILSNIILIASQFVMPPEKIGDMWTRNICWLSELWKALMRHLQTISQSAKLRALKPNYSRRPQLSYFM